VGTYGGHTADPLEERKHFFLKKEAKTLAIGRARWTGGYGFIIKSFLVLFSKKNTLP
jgi:hypothetical protein